MYVGSGESVRVLGVFVCWQALVRVTSQTAAPATPALMKLCSKLLFWGLAWLVS